MKTRFTFVGVLMIAGGQLHAQSTPFAAWTHRTSVEVSRPGLNRVELPREILDVSLATTDDAPLRDLRLISPDGVETPFVLEWPRVVRERWVAPRSFRTSLQGDATVVEFEVPERTSPKEVRLQTGHRDFIKAATLEGTLGGTQWRVISDRELVFRQGGSERLRIPFAADAWKSLRITLDDRRGGPVGFTGASLLAKGEDEAPASTEDVRVASREEAGGETRLQLDLGSRNLHLQALRVVARDPLFQREVKLEAPREDGRPEAIVAQRVIYRVALDDRHTEDLELPIRRAIAPRLVVLRIINGDNPPLHIERIVADFTRLSLVFHASTANTWHLLAGNPNAPAPRYDLASLTGEIRSSQALAASAGTLELNPAFNKEATLPESGEGGAALDVSTWAFRKPVSFDNTGVVSVELDAEALAHATPDLRDVRMMQEGRQLPYFIERNLPLRETEVSFVLEPDPKRPALSRWRVDLPFEGYPVTQVMAESSSQLFERRVRAWEDTRDAYANSYRRIVGEAFWQRSPGRSSGALVIPVTSRPSGGVLYLETDNGDNAAVPIHAMRVAYAPAAVVFKVSGDAPVHLVYGNPRASTPRYDIQLVRSQFEKAGKADATLGAEERTEVYREPDRDARGVGSAWLWLALALVVGGLLWIVAKTLPAEAKTR